jgi:hypothetical protein
MPQRGDIFVGNATKAEPVGDAVHMTSEPRQTVGERAVKIEDD